MGRPSKYNEETTRRFLELISSGRTIKDTAFSVDISDMTISRWEACHNAFRVAVDAAMRKGWDYAAGLKADGYRTYRRSKECYKHPVQSQKAHTGALEGSRGNVSSYHKGRTIMGLTIRPRIDDGSLEPFVNPDNWQVEWRTKDGVYHSCSLDAWERSHQLKADELFIYEWH